MLDLTSAMGKLLTDRDLRGLFKRDRSAAAQTIGIREADRLALLTLNIEQIERQAHALILKRYHETHTLLPETCARLGTSAVELFITYAERRWPSGHLRHYDDAVHFCRFLLHERWGICPTEFNRARFQFERRGLLVNFVRDTAARKRHAVQIVYKQRSGTPREILIYLGFA